MILKESKMKQSITITLLVCLLSCGNKEIIDKSISVVDIEKNTNNFRFVNLSDIVNEVSYVPLETHKDELIQFIQDIIILNDRFIIKEVKSCKTHRRSS